MNNFQFGNYFTKLLEYQFKRSLSMDIWILNDKLIFLAIYKKCCHILVHFVIFYLNLESEKLSPFLLVFWKLPANTEITKQHTDRKIIILLYFLYKQIYLIKIDLPNSISTQTAALKPRNFLICPAPSNLKTHQFAATIFTWFSNRYFLIRISFGSFQCFSGLR